MMDEVIGRKGPSDGRTPGADRDMGAVQGRQRGGNKQGKAFTGSREELVGPSSIGGKRRLAVEASGQGNRPCGQLLRARARWGGDRR